MDSNHCSKIVNLVNANYITLIIKEYKNKTLTFAEASLKLIIIGLTVNEIELLLLND